jgi:hypothetical protein
MKCIVCHGEDIALREVTEEIKRSSDVVCVPVSVLVCAQCGERNYDRPAMRRIEEIRRDVAEGDAALREVGKVLLYTR